MKKILFILILCIIKLNAWELICRDYVSSTQTAYQYYYDLNTNTIKFQYLYNGQSTVSATSPNQYYFWYGLYNVKSYNGAQGYRSIENVKNQLKSDVTMLDAFYRLAPQVILNFYYNPNRANLNDHINYTDYELLYNSDGLIIESVVNGVWRGLYDGPDNSGYLYNEKDELKYINGVPVSFFDKINDKIMKKFKINLESIFIKKIFYPLFVLIFACVIFRAVIRMAVKAFLIRFYDNKIRRLEKRRENIENA